MTAGCIERSGCPPHCCRLLQNPKGALRANLKENLCKKCENRKSEKLSKVCRVPAGSPQNRSGGVGRDAGVPRAFDTFRKSKNLASAPFGTLMTEVSTLWVWTRRGL